MANRHTKKIMPQSELEMRRHNYEVRKFKNWCNEHNIEVKSYYEASPNDICILSKSDYDIFEYKKNISIDNDSYFLTPEDYEVFFENVSNEYESMFKSED